MSSLTVYHGTPVRFDTLNKGSWVSTSLFEAAFHLFQKNWDIPDQNLDDGWMLTIPNFNTHYCLDYIDIGGVINFTTGLRLPISESMRKPLIEVIETFPSHMQAMFRPVEVYDLKALLKT